MDNAEWRNNNWGKKTGSAALSFFVKQNQLSAANTVLESSKLPLGSVGKAVLCQMRTASNMLQICHFWSRTSEADV